jgi:hypothetical protein
MTDTPRAPRPRLRHRSGEPMPEWLSENIYDARDRERAILDLQAAITAASGPDEHEQAKAHLLAYLDKIDEQDRTDLARLGYAR